MLVTILTFFVAVLGLLFDHRRKDAEGLRSLRPTGYAVLAIMVLLTGFGVRQEVLAKQHEADVLEGARRPLGLHLDSFLDSLALIEGGLAQVHGKDVGSPDEPSPPIRWRMRDFAADRSVEELRGAYLEHLMDPKACILAELRIRDEIAPGFSGVVPAAEGLEAAYLKFRTGLVALDRDVTVLGMEVGKSVSALQVGGFEELIQGALQRRSTMSEKSPNFRVLSKQELPEGHAEPVTTFARRYLELIEELKTLHQLLERA